MEPSSKAKIAYLSSRYHWSSFSLVRSLFEVLALLGHEVKEYDPEGNTDFDGEPVEQVWVVSSMVPIPNTSKPVVLFGLSDPNLYSEERASRATVYVSLSREISREHGYHYFPPFADLRYFKWDGCQKSGCVVIGAGKHPAVPERVEMVEALRGSGVRVRTYGFGWPAHEDSFPFASGEKLVSAYAGASLCIDLTNGSTSMGCRIFQSAACWTPVLTFGRPDVLEAFREDTEILCYRDTQGLIRNAKMAEYGPEILKQVGARAHQRCQGEHDVHGRLRGLLGHLEEVL